MKLDQSAIASVDERTEATLTQMVEDGDISEEWMGLLLQAFKQISSKGDTELLMLLAIACISVLDEDCFESIEFMFQHIDRNTIKYQTLTYDILNQVDKGLKS